MSAREMLGERSVVTQSGENVVARSAALASQGVVSKRVRAYTLLIGLSASIHGVGCASDGQDLELGEADQGLVTAEDGADEVATGATARTTAVNSAQIGRVAGKVVQTGGTGVLGGGTIVVAFTRDPDGAWHCTGDADCNKMFLSGVCKGGILDSSCDTTKGVECWCY